MAVIDPESKRGTYQKIAKIAFVAIGLAVTAPLAFYALEGLILWGAFAATGLVLMNFAPAFGTWLANKKIQALVAAVEANPIETMQNLYAEKKEEFQRQEDAVTEFDTQFKNVSDMVDGLKRTDPE